MNSFRIRVVVALLVVSAATAAAQTAGAAKYAGRLLTDVLRELQTEQLNIVFSSELVRPDLRVLNEPKSSEPRKILNEVLRPHGLEVRSGPNRALLVVRGRRSLKSTTVQPGSFGAIAGTVVDARTAAPLPGVLITI